MKLYHDKSRKPLLILPLIILVAVVVGLVAWHENQQNPTQAFNDMLTNNLSLSSYAKTVSLDQSGTHIDQVISLDFKNKRSHWQTTASQADNTVSTESVGQPGIGYIRYLSVGSQAKGATKDYLVIINKWAKSSPNDDLAKLYDQSVADVGGAPLPPMGYLGEAQKRDLVDFINQKQVFKTDFSKVKSIMYGRQPAYQYQVAVNQANYTLLMQMFARDMGVKPSTLSADPSKLKNAPAINLELTVSKSSHRLLSVSYTHGAYLASYEYNDIKPIEIPKTTMPLAQLQKLTIQ